MPRPHSPNPDARGARPSRVLLLALTVAMLCQPSCAQPRADAGGAKVTRGWKLVIDAEKARTFGLTPAKIAAQVMAWTNARPNVARSELEGLLLEAPGGKLVRLREVAAVLPDDGRSGPTSRPAPPPADFQKGRVASKALIQGFRELWPGMAKAQAEAYGTPVTKLDPEGLAAVVQTNEVFWVTPEEERAFQKGEFDDEYNLRRLRTALRQFARPGSALTPVQKYVKTASESGQLKGAALELAVRMLTAALLEGRARARYLARHPEGSQLAFRIAPEVTTRGGPVTLSKEEIQANLKRLAASPASAPRAEEGYVWIDTTGELTAFDGLVLGRREGKTYLLACDTKPRVMLHGEGQDAWWLTKVYRTADGENRPAVAFSLDEAGSKRFAKFTAAHKGCRLVLIVDGRALSAPRLRGVISHRGIITGLFTRREVNELIWGLEAGMVHQDKPPAGPER